MLQGDRTSLPGLFEQLREDWVANNHHVLEPGFQAVAVYRFGVWSQRLRPSLRRPLTLIYGLLYLFVRNVYGIEVPRQAKIGRRLRIAHQGGIVIVHNAQLGDDCVIRQGVTIGRAGEGRRNRRSLYPCIGDRVEFGAGAAVVGGIDIGDDVRIAPNAVVMTHVPSRSSVFPPPSRITQAFR